MTTTTLGLLRSCPPRAPGWLLAAASVAGCGDGVPPGPSPEFVPDLAAGQDGPSTRIDYPPPPGFVDAELGGWQLGEPFAGELPAEGAARPARPEGCGEVILGVVRDFRAALEPGGHPDFELENPGGSETVTSGLVQEDLGPDQKPVYTGRCEQAELTRSCPNGQQTTDAVRFDQWYRYAEGVNQPYVIRLWLEQNGSNSTFESHAFFPLDQLGPGDEGRAHDFHFTTEVHLEFRYQGGEAFTFIGDDDVWVFINGKLVLDLGGLHGEASGTVLLDEAAAWLGLAKNGSYPLDLFHAERHTVDSDFRVDANFQFTSCGTIIR